MGTRVTIGDFSVMTGFSKKALRHYHDIGILEPAHIDAHTGYRFYDTSQVDNAHIIRRFRALDMSIPDIKALLSTGDAAVRTDIITGHLRQMEHQLKQTQDAVATLRELLAPTMPSTPVVLRHEPASTIWTMSATVEIADIEAWFASSLRRIRVALTTSGTRLSGPIGGIYQRELFADGLGGAQLFMPAAPDTGTPSMFQVETLPPTDFAVVTHAGDHRGLERSYGTLGTYVHDHLISHEGPIREYYVGAPPSDPTAFTATEICWPVFTVNAAR
ncbi:MerR family transcriptional regulator [[Mycobacterium] crassicus]|uniref:MerR family transcriptional regulator n=1 Tax=[Mycobacterium] crassicus TaxID=2872309 RepID=A0ABU5XGG1_9MYCO|nr:MerR family transcriptional regulator [Mycolicibacter sp. MYC098]MEB3021380.1 MerR family transcriptional regulator [Mycolicibacter sp. MYC098]